MAGTALGDRAEWKQERVTRRILLAQRRWKVTR